jgi:cell division protein FtsB
VAAVGAPLMIFSSDGLPRLRSLERELAQVQRENAEQRRQIEFLRKGVQNLKDNPQSVERIARDELGLVRKNEVVFQFPPTRGGSLERGALRCHPGACASFGCLRPTCVGLGPLPSACTRLPPDCTML